MAQLRDAIRKADGVLIANPDYNHGVPGVLKNTIDWLSRPWAHVNCANLFNDDPDDTGMAGVDIVKMEADGGAIERWDVLQTVGDRRNSAPWVRAECPARESERHVLKETGCDLADAHQKFGHRAAVQETGVHAVIGWTQPARARTRRR